MSMLQILPKIKIQAFVEKDETAAAIEEMSRDRHASRVVIGISMGGIHAAVDAYKNSPTPNIVLVECHDSRDKIFEHLDALAANCDEGTEVVFVGSNNDVDFYRELMQRGVKDYQLVPVSSRSLVSSICDIYKTEDSIPKGKSVAVMGTCGGVGSSTIAHNIAWEMSQTLLRDTLIVDLDLAFGTLNLNFNQDSPYGIIDLLTSKEVIEDTFLERVAVKVATNLQLIHAPTTLERTYDLEKDEYSGLISVFLRNCQHLVMDLPNEWTAVTRSNLISADNIVLVCTPDLASLRNSKALFEYLSSARPNDKAPIIVLNQIRAPKRQEVEPSDFAKVFGKEPLVIPYMPKVFSMAANNGQMLAEISGARMATDIILRIVQDIDVGEKEENLSIGKSSWFSSMGLKL